MVRHLARLVLQDREDAGSSSVVRSGDRLGYGEPELSIAGRFRRLAVEFGQSSIAQGSVFVIDVVRIDRSSTSGRGVIKVNLNSSRPRKEHRVRTAHVSGVRYRQGWRLLASGMREVDDVSAKESGGNRFLVPQPLAAPVMSDEQRRTARCQFPLVDELIGLVTRATHQLSVTASQSAPQGRGAPKCGTRFEGTIPLSDK